MRTSLRSLLVLVARALASAVLLGACARPQPAIAAGPAPSQAVPLPLPDAGPRRCVVHLHGKGERGRTPTVAGDLVHLWPEGNGDGWGGKQWVYFPESGVGAVRAILQGAIAAAHCDRVLLHGFSNGASAAAKLVCAGESFGGKLVGALIDDPVPDHSASACAP
ncbi:MAG: hypothetical protein JST92_17580, partial [Deltaproteobacteria bacterium]|nr:hypothetical protein [Deltaproteobacteria bacterium]